ncbi:hypothetical protein [Myxococcus sp. RHSTA-1-4]|uniref:hypothetical protein n=1 Tax=Myxococcus sp. RHSTA-1-4 TaxID=2874601 RepID=UPI001CBE77A6|nr:hypothetical protein [Myxococcus sp. RHSTA-1-4]MBZ4414914.1 hypothetical protein [Myxococcus sp. RHSTA-1-4]
MMSTLRQSLFLLGCVFAAACTTDAPYYQIAVDAPDTVTLAPGESVPVEITLARLSNETPGEVRLSLQNAPAGVTLAPDVVLPAGEESVTATPTLAVDANTTQTGVNSTLLLAEDAAKDFASGARFYVVILPPPAAQPDFSISVEPRQVDIFAGQSTQVMVKLTRAEGFTGEVTLTLQSPTNRITADSITFTSEQTSRLLFIYSDRAATRIPVTTTLVATSADSRIATTGLTVNLQ